MRSRTSSTIWKHMPRWRPNSVSASRVGSPTRRHHAADAARRREQRRGLALDRRRVGLLGAVDVEEVLQLEDLPAAQLADGGGEQRGDLGAERRRERRRPGEQEVAGEDRDDVAPAGVHARDAPPGLGLVDDVVVVERPEVHQLDGDAAGDRVGRAGPVRAVGARVRARRASASGRSRLPPAAMRWLATSARNGSGVRTDSRRAGSTRARSSGERRRGRRANSRRARGGRKRFSRPLSCASRYAASGTFSKPAVVVDPGTAARRSPACRSNLRMRGEDRRSGADYTGKHVRIRTTRGGFQPCSNASPTEPAESSSWRRKKRACSTTTTSAPSTSCSA